MRIFAVIAIIFLFKSAPLLAAEQSIKGLNTQLAEMAHILQPEDPNVLSAFIKQYALPSELKETLFFSSWDRLLLNFSQNKKEQLKKRLVKAQNQQPVISSNAMTYIYKELDLKFTYLKSTGRFHIVN